jgi:hypothetical protein
MRFTLLVRKLVRIVPCLALTVSGATAKSCGNSPEPTTPTPPATGGGSSVVTITGREKIGWTQVGDTAGMRFDIFVDSNRSTLTGATCAASQGQSDCSAPLPTMTAGQHSLELVAITATGVESSHSSALVVMKSASSTDSLTVVSQPAATDARAGAIPARACAGDACFTISTIANGAGRIDRVASLPDGRILILRGGREILLLDRVGVLPAYDLARDDPRAAAIADLALDPAYQQTKLLYAAVLTRDIERTTVRIVRLREVAGRFGEAATIVPDLPVARDGVPALAVTSDQRLYLAMPGRASARGRDPYEGVVLAFTTDGQAAGTTAGSPVLSVGTARPGAIAADGKQLLIGAIDLPLAAASRLLTIDAAKGVTATAVGDAATSTDIGLRAVTFADPQHGVLITATPPSLELFTLAANGNVVFMREPLALGRLEPSAVAIAGSGDILVAASDRASGSMVLLRLQRDVAQR